MHKDVLFRGCTRPAMFLGVPYIPFFIGAGGGLLLGMYFNLWYLLTIPVIIFVMQQVAKRDEMIFRLLGLRWLFRMRVRNIQRYSECGYSVPTNIESTPLENVNELIELLTNPTPANAWGWHFARSRIYRCDASLLTW